MKIQVLGQFKSHTIVVMATQSSMPSRQVRSPTTPTGEESVTPVSQPSGLGELSASMFTEPDRKQEVIQRAQVGSLMGANGNREPQDKTPKKQSPALATRPKRYALEMWVEIKTSAGVHSTPKEDSYSVDFARHYQLRLPWVYWHVPRHAWPHVGLLWKEDEPESRPSDRPSRRRQ